MTPTVSVIIPAYNAEHHLRFSLDCLIRSTVQPFEVIVVDDSSSDGSAAVAREFGAKVLTTEGRQGPAAARNLAAAEACGDVLFFVDADVCVHPDTLGTVGRRFARDPLLDGLIGSYDESPGVPTLLSQYRNLLHCFVHQSSSTAATTFWSGCGAIRRQLFLEHGGFNPDFKRPSIEDIELGARLAEAGCRIELDKQLRVKHLKRWSFWSLAETDILHRGIPWTELILRTGRMPNDLNLRTSHRVSVALVAVFLLVATAGVVGSQGSLLVPLLAILFLSLGRYWVEALADKRGRAITFAMALILSAIAALSYYHQLLPLVPVLVAAYSLLYLRHRYSYGTEESRRFTGVLYGLYLAGAISYVLAQCSDSFLLFGCLSLAVALVALNLRFYLFLASRLGFLGSLAAIPFHLLHYIYCGLALLAGVVLYGWRSLSGGHPPVLRPSRRVESGD